ncbi:hypothetical protein [Actinomadura logoneensis]|uniref:hypothetical protein n=1 Tax=Actinomadura logoneensis TaxID=2293572 RepID=UPI001314ADF6|nr:hypothetical protein [Actinomadura logoneensis]
MISWNRRSSVLGALGAAGVAAALTATLSTNSWAAADAPSPTAPAPAASGVQTSHLKGWARMDFPVPDNDIQVTVDAHATFDAHGSSTPTRSWGTFRIYHRAKMPDGSWFTNWGVLAVDCLTTGGPTATVTGTLTKVAPGGPWEGMLRNHDRMGISFYVAGKHGGPGRIGLSGGPGPGDGQLRKCMAPAADARILKGGYTLIDKR